MDPQILAVFSPIFSHQLGLPGNELTVIHVENRQLKYLGGWYDGWENGDTAETMKYMDFRL